MFLIQAFLLLFIIVYGVFYYYTGVFPTTGKLFPFASLENPVKKNTFSEHIHSMLFETEDKTLIPPDVDSDLPPSSSFLNIYKEAAICSDSNVCSDIGK